MGTKKDIGKVFKEHFKDFEQAPDTAIWDSIASELDKKGNKRIIPLWYYFGGLIIIGFIGTLSIFINKEDIIAPSNNKFIQDSFTVNEDLQNTINSQSLDKESIKSTQRAVINDSLKVLSTNPSREEEKKELEITDTGNDASQSSRKKFKTNYKTKSEKVDNKKSLKISSPDNSSTDENIATTSGLVNMQEQPDVTVATIKKLLQVRRDKQKAKNQEVFSLNKEELLNKEKETTYKNKPTETPQEVAERLAANQKKENKKPKKVSVNEESKPKTDEERAEDRRESVKYAIAISPYTSILSYGSLTKGSSLDDRLVDNPREAITTIGYGLRAEYTLSERTRLRLGVGYSPLKYRTNNFQVSVNNGAINIFELAAISGLVLSQGGITTENTPEAIAFFNTNNVVSIQQDISYLEVPLDFQYMFLNKRFGLSVSPGVSLFILDDNSIFATADNGESLFIGKESNLTSLSLAVNLGLGAHYNLNSSWRFNVEPVFRYQLNPYSNSISNFRPYYFGAQFGVSYKF